MKRSTYNRLKKKAEARSQILNEMFIVFYSIKDMTVDRAIEIIKPYTNVLSAQLNWLTCVDFFGGDSRRGWQTYGFKSDEEILNNLQYISDRWNCQFRVQWVLDLLNERN